MKSSNTPEPVVTTAPGITGRRTLKQSRLALPLWRITRDQREELATIGEETKNAGRDEDWSKGARVVHGTTASFGLPPIIKYNF